MYGQDFRISSETRLTNPVVMEESTLTFTGHQELYSDAWIEIHLEIFFHHESRAKFYFFFDIEESY